MKNRFTIVLAMMMLGVMALQSQTVITHQNHAPQVGYSFTIKSLLDPVDAMPGPDGANVTWDFSDFIGDEEFTSNFVNPDDTPFVGFLNEIDANVAIEIVDEEDGGYGFLNVQQQQATYEAIGFMIEGNELFFTAWDPAPVMMKFPFAYGESYETYGEMTFDFGDDFIMITKEWSTTTADAWGTLINPVATYNNVLRLKTTVVDSSFIYYQGQQISAERYEYLDYTWFSANKRSPIQSLSGEMYEDEFWADMIDYLFEESASVSQPAAQNLTTYPNPVSNVLVIENIDPANAGRLMISDIAGRVVMDIGAISGESLHVDVSHLSEGIYLLQQLNGNRLISSSKIVISR